MMLQLTRRPTIFGLSQWAICQFLKNCTVVKKCDNLSIIEIIGCKGLNQSNDFDFDNQIINLQLSMGPTFFDLSQYLIQTFKFW